MSMSERLAKLSPEQRAKLAAKLAQREKADKPSAPKGSMDFSLFFFSADARELGSDAYNLLLDAARYGDANGFSAIWTPERHFGNFGGIYPNPTLLAAALSTITERIGLRAGSLVLPLHHPVRVAEDWAVIDNLSKGRASISMATGWHPHDYVINPNAYTNRNEIMFRNIELVRRLWAGESVEIPGVEGKTTTVTTLPRPVQKELPIWVTATSKTTWERAGSIGANILSALIAMELDQLTELIHVYRQARARNGHDPRKGRVSLMLHTYIGEGTATVKDLVREPMKSYLTQYIDQFKAMADGQTDFPDENALLEFAFERYYDHRSLLGDPQECSDMVQRLVDAGVDEIACLLDFGLTGTQVMDGLNRLNHLRERWAEPAKA